MHFPQMQLLKSYLYLNFMLVSFMYHILKSVFLLPYPVWYIAVFTPKSTFLSSVLQYLYCSGNGFLCVSPDLLPELVNKTINFTQGSSWPEYNFKQKAKLCMRQLHPVLDCLVLNM